jgi:hypothetical protein
MSLRFDMSFASHKRAIYWSERNTIKPEDVSLYDRASKYWFKCDVCPHEFETLPYSIKYKNRWCPYCSNQKLCDDIKCVICFNKSFASSDKAEYWSSKNTVNPRTVFKSSSKKFIFNCNKCMNEFTAMIGHISKGTWCKSCGYISSREKNSMKLKEFLERCKEVHGDTYDYSKVIMNGVDRNVPIICKIHGEFLQTPYHHLGGAGCPQCGIIKVADSNRRYTLDEFITKANEIHKNKYDYSKVIMNGVDRNVPIICKIHGEFIQDLYNHLRGAGCSICVNKTESKLYMWLKSIYPNVVKEYTVDWCINPNSGRCLRYDFMIPDTMTIIELDGGQHFKQVRNWVNPLYTMKKDIFKMQKAKDKGYKIIRILQQDVYKNNEEWLNENLLSEINNPDRIDIFISSIDNIYDEHIKLIESGIVIALDDFDSLEEDNNSET